MDSKYKKLFESINIGKCKIKNRFVMAPMGPMGLGDFEGGFNQRGIDYYVERAKGGTGLITTGAVSYTHLALFRLKRQKDMLQKDGLHRHTQYLMKKK